MKKSMYFILMITCYLLSTILFGCATAKEMGKGFLGVSTQVLEQKRKDALKKSFALSYNDCYAKVKDILTKDVLVKDALDKEADAPYIYSEDSRKKMVAIYLSQTDTTPVGIFFTEQTGSNTLIEISSPSTYAKEKIANIIFSGLVADNQSQKENSADDKEKTSD